MQRAKDMPNIAFWLAAFVLFGTGGLTAGGTDDWAFGVYADGFPRMDISPLRLAGSGGLTELHLEHQIVFDGIDYSSQIRVTELSSCLVEQAAGQYLWTNLKGKQLIISALGVVDGNGKGWALIAKNGLVIIRTIDEEEKYVYQHTRLLEAKIGLYQYRFIYQDGGLLSVVETTPDSAEIIACQYGPELELKRVIFNSGKGVIECSSPSCVDTCSLNGRPVYKFSYQANGLLRFARWDGGGCDLVWGEVQDNRGFIGSRLPPAVVSDGCYNYTYSRGYDILNVTAKNRKNGHTQKWRYSYLRNRVQRTL